jgi:hypothetical protein
MNYKSIIISSPPRTGSMWTLNILREIFLNQKLDILPKKIPRDDKEAFKYHLKNINDNNSKSISIIKFEEIIEKKDTKNTKIIVNFRDPRDAVISFKYFMKHIKFEFKDLLELIKKNINWIEYYRNNFDKEHVLEINFNDINANPIKVFKQLEVFLGLKINQDTIEKIISKFSKSKVLSIIRYNDRFVKEAFNNNKNLNNEKVVVENNKIIRAYDVDTGFQTGHISNYNEKQRNNVFSKTELDTINTLFKDWFKTNDFTTS